MSFFAYPITPPPKGSWARSNSVPSFLGSEYLIIKEKDRTPFDITTKDMNELKLYPEYTDTKTITDHLERTEDTMLVLLPAHEKLKKSIIRYKRSTENLKDISAQLQQTQLQADETKQLLLEVKQDHAATLQEHAATLQEHTSKLEHLQKRVTTSDSKRLTAYRGNLIIEMVKRLSDKHNIESEVKGNDPEACKQKLVRAAETLMNDFGTPKKKDGRVMESEEDVKRNWQEATGLLPKYMSALKKFEEKVEARKVFAHETAGQLAQLLMEKEHFETHNYHYLGGLIRFLYGKTVEEMAKEEDIKDAKREAEERSED